MSATGLAGGMMTGIEIAVGYMFAWAVRKSRRVADRADGEVNRGLDAAMDKLHTLVSQKLGGDAAVQKLAEEADTGQNEPSDRTRQRVQLALEDAAEQDPDFAEALHHAVRELQALSRPDGGPSTGDGGQVIGGNVTIRADQGSVAAWSTGNVALGNPPQPDSHQV
ncbi:hypothetical protein OG226_01125 [Streptomyces sp. NBC_01261]|uniref:hypothetical protein n=1 Tax=Streptomyces sp. NBC_01261 TaxID=2903802 RepID=UPI002E3778E2|nr:hypothetical protein [Streptomyces sp. NBC_01261]